MCGVHGITIHFQQIMFHNNVRFLSKNFIETKINFSPSPLWFSKSVLWVLATTFHDSSPKPSLLIQQHVYTQTKEKKPIQQVILALIQRYSCAGIFCYFQTVCSSSEQKVFTYQLLHNGFWPSYDQRCNTVIMSEQDNDLKKKKKKIVWKKCLSC